MWSVDMGVWNEESPSMDTHKPGDGQEAQPDIVYRGQVIVIFIV